MKQRQVPTRAVVAAVQLPGVSDIEFEHSVNELRGLGKTLGFEIVGTFAQKRVAFDTTGYLGVGKRQELRRFVEGEPEPRSFLRARQRQAGDEEWSGQSEGGAAISRRSGDPPG